MNKYKTDRWQWLLPALFLIAACNITGKYQSPAVNTNNLYRDAALTDSSSAASIPYRLYFTDTILISLIGEGLQMNLDLKAALTHIDAAKAVFRQSRQAFLPAVNGAVSVKESKLAFPQSFGLVETATQYDAGITASWEADIWGRLSSAKRSALAELLQTEAAGKAVQTRLIAEIASGYYLLLALDEQLRILEKTLANREDDVEAMKKLKESNIVTGAAVVQSEANRYAAKVAIPPIRRRIRETENVLNLLLAKPSGEIKRTTLNGQHPVQTLQTGVPAGLLQNRPDVLQAEYAFRAAFEKTNVARTAFYPSLNVTAAAGFTSFQLKDWFTADGLFANVMGTVLQPVFNKGLNRSRLAVATAQQQRTLYEFQQTVLKAGQEVSDALFSYQTALEQQSTRVLQLDMLEKSVDYTKKLLKYSSSTNYTDVLTSEQDLLAAQLEQVNDQLLQWQSVIALYRALGGGWK